ncbi:cytochrome P450 [Nocardia sp. CNY236]|uniref:cytochrome P450 n=1 Tax=Nocardia sp. CNY236 TaxID=1169152 RepID=UPI0003F7B08D|nr:cytochrome P450 [Nocardia sp. CNY236]
MIRAQVPRSRLPKLLHGMLSDRGDTFACLARRYPAGVTVPLPGRPLHVLNGPEAVKHVLVTAADRYEKGIGQAEARAGLGRGILTDDGETWMRARGSLGPWLRARRIQQHAPAIHRYAVDSVTELAGPHPRRIPVDGFLAEYTLQCLAAVLGVPAPHIAPVLAALDVVQDDAMFRVVTQDRIPTVLRPRAEQRLREARTVLDRAADEVIAAVDSGVPESDPPLWANRDDVISLLLAGYETTSSTLTWAVEELSRRPALADALAEERDAADDPTDDPADLLRLTGQLRLTTAVVKEVLRLHPAVWLVSRRALRDDVVAGWPIRTGDDVCIVVAEAHQQGWAEPDLFDPDRFLTNDHRGRYLPFGLGPRGCPGASLAHLEATLWLAEANRRLTLRPVLGRRTRALARMSMTTMPGTPYLIARRTVARAALA